MTLNSFFKQFDLSVKYLRNELWVFLKDGFPEEVVLVTLDVGLIGFLDVGPEGGGVSGHFCHEVEDGETVDPGVGGSYGLEDVFVEVPRIVEDSEHGCDALVTELIRFKIVIDGGFGKDGKDIVEKFGASFLEHLLGDDSELHVLVESVDLAHDPGDHLGCLLVGGLFEVGVLGEGVVVGVVGCAFVLVGGRSALVVEVIVAIHF